MYNIVYEKSTNPGEIYTYLGVDSDYETCQKYLTIFYNKYVGKPYPNGKGWYPCINPRIARVK